jgi:hypothetical protein
MQLAALYLATALFACFMAIDRRLAAQSPFFPNNNAVTYNPWGVGLYTNSYAAQAYGQSFPFQQLPAAYSQPLPGSNASFQGVNYPTNPGYGGSMYIQNYRGSGYYNPYRQY